MKKLSFMKLLAQSVVVGAVALSGTVAFADIEITCNWGDCLTQGWEIYDQRTGETLVVDCRGADCLTLGWSSFYQGRKIEDTICMPGGCFGDGWRVYDSRTGRQTSETKCLNSFASTDCLDIGWTTTDLNRATTTFRCTNGDCRNVGWDVGYPPRPLARCKPGGCFVDGWIIYR